MDVDTIASLSTAPGVGAIAIIRVSGPGAGPVLMALCPRRAQLPDPRSPTLVDIADPDDGSPIDRAIVTFFEGPASYTGEDLVELSCHGGWLIPELVLEACLRAGARRAEAGEFTRRAYLRGKLDLVQAEAVADLIGARSRAMHRAALGQLEQGLSRRVSELRGELVRLEALLVHHIDFPEEDEPPVSIERVAREADALVSAMDAMLATAPEGELMREGALTVFAGRPNVGKSSLYNALLGVERAIVTEHAGTTRDALEATVQLGGFPFRLVDTAGLREGGGEVESLGIEVARRYVDRADLVVLCIPANEGPTESDIEFAAGLADTPVVVVETKADLVPEDAVVPAGGDGPEGVVPPADGANVARPEMGSAPTVRMSVLSGVGIDELRRLLPRLVFSAVVQATPDTPLLTRERHARALGVARREVDAFRAALLEGLPAEVAATHLLPAATALEEMLGVVSVDDVLDVVFREFCVGK